MNFFKKHKRVSVVSLILIGLAVVGSVFYTFNANGALCGNPNSSAYYTCKYPNDTNTYSQACVNEYSSHNLSSSTLIQLDSIPCPGVPQ